jgi:hypothetical protein
LAYTFTNDRKRCRVEGHAYYTDAANMLGMTHWGAQLFVPLCLLDNYLKIPIMTWIPDIALVMRNLLENMK